MFALYVCFHILYSIIVYIIYLVDTSKGYFGNIFSNQKLKIFLLEIETLVCIVCNLGSNHALNVHTLNVSKCTLAHQAHADTEL